MYLITMSYPHAYTCNMIGVFSTFESCASYNEFDGRPIRLAVANVLRAPFVTSSGKGASRRAWQGVTLAPEVLPSETSYSILQQSTSPTITSLATAKGQSGSRSAHFSYSYNDVGVP